MKNADKKPKKAQRYNPNLGFIGQSEVKVSNYLFSGKKLRTSYQHTRPITSKLLEREIVDHYDESRKLTKFLKNRDLTFSKKTQSGEYKTFTVPCTTTVVPMQKSLFNEVENASQKLMIALRKVIQDIYGSKSIEASSFVKALPDGVREIFIDAIKSSSNYFPQLHHPNMKDYPFLDNVGLDLVLVEDYIEKSKEFPQMIKRKDQDNLPGLPFRILEINAGSPSGASNNMNVLQGLYEQAPEMLDALGNVMPNDHFKILGETYKSLGEAWTGNTEGVQILPPPGGQNGAAPEIHQLAAYSGLLYTDANQLYQDKQGHIRLRTVDKENPIVTAIYSRVNADSALFDLKKKLILKDPDSAEPLYLRDNLIKDEEDEGRIITDEKGRPIPQQSDYAIPGVIDAIINRKIYMGGLNRILDNKIILATLTHYAPKFFAKDIKAHGFNTKTAKILPPQTLPPTIKSVEIILQNPDEWVVKSPSLAGGEGVYILKTLPQAKKQEVLEEIQKNPTKYAYQQLVRIARIPVAVQRKSEGFKFANLAADIRTWIFYGGGEKAIPRMSHNALVRYAPQEKGKMSSIVNTSAGGGYAPFIIVDDVKDKKSVNVKELIKDKQTIVHNVQLPVFVAAQLIQVSRMLQEANKMLKQEKLSAMNILNLIQGLKYQLKEIVSYLNPRSISPIYSIIDLLETKINKTEIKKYNDEISKTQAKIVSVLIKIETKNYFYDLRSILDNIRALDADKLILSYSESDYALDNLMLEELDHLEKKYESQEIQKIKRYLNEMMSLTMAQVLVGPKTKKNILNLLETFCFEAKTNLTKSHKRSPFAELLCLNPNVTSLKFETLFLGERDHDKEILTATQREFREKKSLISDLQIGEELSRARNDWAQVISLSESITPDKRFKFIEEKRSEHFGKYPLIKEYNDLIKKKSASPKELIKLLEIAPYAKFNIQNFANAQNCSVEDLFTSKLNKDKISILDTKTLKRLKLANREHAGECFAKKKKSHGLYSNSDIYIWIRKELDPFTQVYTIGHELIHYHQIKNSMEAEKRALKDGGVSIAKFLNYYGNFLGANHRSIDKIEFDLKINRTPLYGYADKIANKEVHLPIIKELDKAIRISDEAWDSEVRKYGSLLGYMMPNSTATRVKALQEVLPALENAKNILFAQSLGLEVALDPVKSALPAANSNQVEYYRSLVIQAAKQVTPQWEALRIIASHQYHGVYFFRADKCEQNLQLIPIMGKVAVGSSYNQTQQ